MITHSAVSNHLLILDLERLFMQRNKLAEAQLISLLALLLGAILLIGNVYQALVIAEQKVRILQLWRDAQPCIMRGVPHVYRR